MANSLTDAWMDNITDRDAQGLFWSGEDNLFTKTRSSRILIASVFPGDSAGDTTFSSKEVSSLDDVRQQFSESDNGPACDSIIAIHQDFSECCLSITKDVFWGVLQLVGPFEDFLHVVSAYGAELQCERAYYSHRMRAYTESGSGRKHELCYNVPAMEKRPNDKEFPWSMRQTGIYQQILPGAQSSKWIMINLRQSARKQLEKSLSARPRCCHLRLHADLLIKFAWNWGEYIEDLKLKVSGIGDLVTFEGIEPPIRVWNEPPIRVWHEDIPNGHPQSVRCRQIEIERAIHGVTSAIEIANACQQYFNGHTSKSDASPPACKECLDSLEVHKSDLNYWLRCLKRLNRDLEGIQKLSYQVLMLKNQDGMQTLNKFSNRTLNTLLEIAQQSRGHQEITTQLQRATSADSVLLKILAIVGTVCLPASLVAGVFSSNLIQTEVVTAKPERSRMVLSPQFWVYVVIALPLMVATLVWTLLVDRRSHQKAAAALNKRSETLPSTSTQESSSLIATD